MRPGLHLSNVTPGIVCPADLDLIQRWAPLSALLAMNVNSDPEADLVVEAWNRAGQPLLVLRQYFPPECGPLPNKWALHADESIQMARRCIARGVPKGKVALKPFNEPNMPTWAQWEGFGDKPAEIERYNNALNAFIDRAKDLEPEVLIGGPHLTVGNKDCRMGGDAQGEYYYHGADGRFESSLCYSALQRVDLHFVHCYGMHPGEHLSPYHGLRFVEYCKYMGTDKPVYIVESNVGMGSTEDVRAYAYVEYLRALDDYPYVKGITFFIGGERGWDAFRHSDSWDDAHRPVVFAVEEYVKGNSQPEPPPPPPPPPPPEPGEVPELELRTYDGRELRGDVAHEYIRQEYGSGVVRFPGSIFPKPLEGDLVMRVVRIEEVEGPNIVKCRTKKGGAVTFGFRWDDGPEQFENEWYARGASRAGSEVDFVYGSGSIAFPPNGGGHALWVLGQPSDLADRWGWKPLTDHRALYVTFDSIPYKEGGMPNEVDYPGAAWVGPAATNNFATGRGGQRVQHIVLHGTGKGENVPCEADLATQAINWFKDPASGVSAHYVVSRVGDVYQVVREADTAYHAGDAGYNQCSIGIEGEHCGHLEHPWTAETINRIIEMLQHLAAKYNLVRGDIILHKEVPGVNTACPAGFPKDYVLDAVFGATEEPSVEEILMLVYGAIWTDKWAGMVYCLEHGHFWPVFFADRFQGRGVIRGFQVDWQWTPEFLIYWLNAAWGDTRALTWPPNLGS